MRYVEKRRTVGQATDNNKAHKHCILDNYCYKFVLRICNTNRFSPATMVSPACHNVTLHVHSLPNFALRTYYYCHCCGFFNISQGKSKSRLLYRVHMCFYVHTYSST
jgi:hypothetical protein